MPNAYGGKYKGTTNYWGLRPSLICGIREKYSAIAATGKSSTVRRFLIVIPAGFHTDTRPTG
jgi:hypothetical protein